MTGVLLQFPKCHLLKVTLTTPRAAAFVARSMQETCVIRKPWYGFQITPGTEPIVSGCCITARVNNPNGDTKGLEVNKENIGLHKYYVSVPEATEFAQGNRLAPVIPIA